ncbi:MAG: hypothetical protein KatS3mg038_0334 [Candidatus Kapaibacterium sp.]|nr:MAG: hypothetical protein KatS3mg038_0334 [Candidatus Kapabacteria bacterium]
MIRATIDDVTLQKLASNLRELAPSLERKYVRQALGRAATVIIRAVRRNLANRPHSKSARGLKRKGKPIVGLRKSVMQRPSSQWPSGAALAAKGLIGTVVGHKWPEGAHAHLVEFGHRLEPRKKFGKPFRQGVPARVPPHPFMKPAMQSSKSQVREILRTAVVEGLRREAARLARGGRTSAAFRRLVGA